jgi:type I restriction enzyme S subunit
MRESADTFPADWDTKTIGDIACHVGSGATPTGGSSVYSKTGITFIRSQNVTFKGLLLDDVTFIGTSIHQQMARSEIFPHDVLLNITGASIGRCCFVPPNFGLANVNQHVCAIRLPRPSHEDAVFLAGVLASHIGQSQIDRLNAGGNREGLNYQQVRSFVVPWPRSEERKRIAAILETADEAIAKTKAVIAKLKQVRAGLLHDLLTRGLDETGELRDPESHSEQFIESNLGLMPKTWKVGAFRDFRSPDRPYLKTGPFGSSLKQEHWVPEGVPVVTIGSLGEGQFIHSELLHVSEETACLLSAYALLPGDIVFSRVADVGRSVVVTEAERGWLMSSNMMWISLDQRIAAPDYVQANIAANEVVRAQIRQLVNAAGRDVANAAVLNAVLLPWAPCDEQKRIVAVLRSADSRLQAEQVELQKLRLLRQGLMSDLLTGRVRVPEEIVAVS